MSQCPYRDPPMSTVSVNRPKPKRSSAAVEVTGIPVTARSQGRVSRCFHLSFMSTHSSPWAKLAFRFLWITLWPISSDKTAQKVPGRKMFSRARTGLAVSLSCLIIYRSSRKNMLNGPLFWGHLPFYISPSGKGIPQGVRRTDWPPK